MPAPATPTGVNCVKNTSDGSIDIFWSPPTGTVTSYTVYSDPVVQAHPNGITVNDTTVNYTGLTIGKKYKFTVKATNSDGSSDLTFPILVLSSKLPSVPIRFSSTIEGIGRLRLWWYRTSVESMGNRPNTYELTCDNPNISIPSTLMKTLYRIRGITSTTPINFTLYAKNAAGKSTTAATLTVSPSALPPTLALTPLKMNAPTVSRVIDPQAYFLKSKQGTASVNVSWTPPTLNGCVLHRYDITCVQTGEIQRAGRTATSYVFKKLNYGTSYTFKISAYCVVSRAVYVFSEISDASSSITPYTTCGKIEGVEITNNPVNGALTLTWDPPTFFGGYSGITGYKLYYKLTNTGNVITENIGASTTSKIFERSLWGNTPSRRGIHEFKIIPTNAYTVFDTASNSVIKLDATTIWKSGIFGPLQLRKFSQMYPLAPTNIIVSKKNGKTDLKWTRSVTNDSVILYYTVVCTSVTPNQTVYVKGNAASFAGLPDGARFSITAKADTGVSPTATT